MIGALRCAFRLAAIIVLTLACVALHLGWRAAGVRSPWPRRYLGCAGRAAGFVASVEGAPLREHVFFVANHVSWADVLVLAGTSGCAFVARDDLGEWPVVGWLAAQNNTILVARSARGTVAAQVEAVRAAVDGVQPVALFPEGTTGDGRVLLPFKPSLLAVMTPPPRTMHIQPVAIDYGREAPEIAWTGDEGGLANVRRILARRGRTYVTLRFLDPVAVDAATDRKALSAALYAAISRGLGPMRDGDGAV